jgi:hypothetical protein
MGECKFNREPDHQVFLYCTKYVSVHTYTVQYMNSRKPSIDGAAVFLAGLFFAFCFFSLFFYSVLHWHICRKVTEYEVSSSPLFVLSKSSIIMQPSTRDHSFASSQNIIPIIITPIYLVQLVRTVRHPPYDLITRFPIPSYILLVPKGTTTTTPRKSVVGYWPEKRKKRGRMRVSCEGTCALMRRRNSSGGRCNFWFWLPRFSCAHQHKCSNVRIN